MNNSPVTRDDLSEIKEDIKSLEQKLDRLTVAVARIELDFARSQAKATLDGAAELSRLRQELQEQRANAGNQLSTISARTAILWGIAGAGVFILFGALVTTVIQRVFR